MKKILCLAVLLCMSSPAVAHHTCNKNEQIKALAMNMYHEARGEGHDGMLAVGEVTLNRVKSNKFPNNICEVVYQGRRDRRGNMIRYKCQFSWYCDGKSDVAYDRRLWKEAKSIASGLINNTYETFGSTATHYHAVYVNPSWSKSYYMVGRIGKHIFYDMGDKS